MRSHSNFSLQNNNSFNIKTISPKVYILNNLEDLQSISDLIALPFYILGEGSNTLFIHEYAPTIIKPDFKGISVKEMKDCYTVTVGAGENWHDLVCYCIDKGIYGLENLSLIPGSVGAAPVQNIGAYGVEFSDFCYEVECFDFNNMTTNRLSCKECEFSYRDSIFKRSANKFIITKVTLKFPKKWTPKLSYGGLTLLNKSSSAFDVMQKVISLRQEKLPDPKELPNAGSFFKNPVVTQEIFEHLLMDYPDLPNYPQSNGKVKLAAGWLIEHCDLKGFRNERVGVHDRQALVLVNYNDGLGSDIVGLAKFIQKEVQNKFSITIIPEVRMISSQGEVRFESLDNGLLLGVNNND